MTAENFANLTENQWIPEWQLGKFRQQAAQLTLMLVRPHWNSSIFEMPPKKSRRNNCLVVNINLTLRISRAMTLDCGEPVAAHRVKSWPQILTVPCP